MVPTLIIIIDLIEKALTSGTIPSFLDVAMNFGDDEMKIDTFLHQLRKRNEKIVFAGDETWKMFRFFEREYANRDSLFVNDFYEGDRNVTESLKVELKKSDWKLLILRKLWEFYLFNFEFKFFDEFPDYLGLDHIGHVEGPFSKLVPPKLKEMNEVIKLIHSTLLEWVSFSRNFHDPSRIPCELPQTSTKSPFRTKSPTRSPS